MYKTLARNAWSRRLDVAGALMQWSGLAWAFEKTCRPAGAIILVYHSVAADELAPYIDPPNRMSPLMFERQMAYLKRHRNVVPLSQLLATIEAGESPPARTVCLTFDDGYLDNLTVAAPILDRYQLPATLYLATGYVARAQPQWADELHFIVGQRTRDTLVVERLGLSVDWSDPAAAKAARRVLHARLLEAERAERDELLDVMRSQLRPAGDMPRLTLNWDECREIARRYPLIELGGHSRDHVDLRNHHGESALSEIAGCKEDLLRELGMEPRAFSFPYARWCDDTRRMVHDCGWESAIGANLNYRIGRSADRFAMARLDTTDSMTALKFKTSGAFPNAIKWLGVH